MNSFKIGGISLKGTYHEINQDYFCCVNTPVGLVLTLSDGVGSCNFSHFGSRALCEAVIELSFENLCEIDEYKNFLEQIQARWLKKLRGFPVNKCSCTALFVIVKDNNFAIFHLGDGVVVVKADDNFTVTLDIKEEDFRNYTDAMDDKLYFEDWKIIKGEFYNLQGIYMSSDGVGVNNESVFRYADFAEKFFNEYADLSANEIESTVETWLKDWYGSDDKTIAFALRVGGEKIG